MKKSVKIALASLGLVAAAASSAAVARSDLDPQIAYSYAIYADAEKTILIGTAADRGCVASGTYYYADRIQLPTPYYDATPMYVCTGWGPTLPIDW